ncbi:hypothetical protein TB2_035682 [Malus domestica]|uniref:Pentatricopeptide repeat-containing protein n=1 Tax=Malus domestica TaxID=3750 RepID=A0A498K011_MALDO|nr:hypothetical protein DVH24_011096 [Malus domestica]
MIRGHAWSKTPRKSVELYKRLVGEQVHKRVRVSGFGGGVEYARLVFDGMRERSVASWNSLLAGYVWCRDVDGAQRIFNEISKWNVVSWTTMIVGCAQNGSVILCERIKDVGNFKAKSGSWKLINYDTPSTSAIYELSDFLPNLCVGSDFRAEDSPRHVGNEGFRIFGERGNLTPTII